MSVPWNLECVCAGGSSHSFREAEEGAYCWREAALLTGGQRRGLADLSSRLRQENEDYLKKHPEVTALVEVFLDEVLQERPRGDFLQLAVDFFTRPEEELQRTARGRLLAAPSRPPPPSTCRISDVYRNPFPSLCPSPPSCSPPGPAPPAPPSPLFGLPFPLPATAPYSSPLPLRMRPRDPQERGISLRGIMDSPHPAPSASSQ